MTQPPDGPTPEWRIREISRETSEAVAQRVVDLLCQRLGIEDMQQTRRNLDFLAAQAEAALGRKNEGRKTVFAVVGGIIMLVAGYVAAAFNLKGHAP